MCKKSMDRKTPNSMRLPLVSMSNEQQEKYHKLSADEVNSAVASLENWAVKESKLHRSLKFKNFVEAFTFMTEVALHAEKMDHHPEWFNVYNTVTVDLMTHAVNGISDHDIKLANLINSIIDRKR
jgi:4a-hydroxytetrahydrobiopterin dehydratase